MSRTQCSKTLLHNFKVIVPEISIEPIFDTINNWDFSAIATGNDLTTFNHKFSMLDDAVDCLFCSSLLKQRDKMSHVRHPQMVWFSGSRYTSFSFSVAFVFLKSSGSRQFAEP